MTVQVLPFLQSSTGAERRKEAQCFRGTRLEKFWEVTSRSPEGWYAAEPDQSWLRTVGREEAAEARVTSGFSKRGKGKKRQAGGTGAKPASGTLAEATAPAGERPRTEPSNGPSQRPEHGDGEGAGAADLQAPALREGQRAPRPVGEPAVKGPLAGHVKSVRVEAFKCHDHFEVEFGRHITFISGANGSGKSAVMSALQACLGASKKQLGADKFGDVVKTGSSSALAAVTLWNQGEDAYKPDLYGPTITVERRISATGHTSWFLKDHNGRKAMTDPKRSDIDDITSHFNINAGNPVQCLTQDMAKSFAGCTNGKTKYDLYIEATGFDQIIIDLNRSKCDVDSMKDNLNVMRELVQALEAKAKEVNERLEALAEVEIWQEELDHLQRAQAWAPVRSALAALEKNRVLIDDRGTRDQQAIEATIAELEGQLERAKEHERILKEAMDASRRAFEAQWEQQAALHAEQKEARGKLTAAKKEATKAGRALEEGQRKLDTLRGTLDQLEARMANSTEDSEVQHAAKLKAAREALDGAETTAKLAVNAVTEAETAKAARTDVVHAKQGKVRGVANQIAELKSELRRQQSAQQCPIAKFGGAAMAMRALHDLVQRNQRRFKEPPLGPLGALLSVEDTKWAGAIEAALKRQMLEAWIVDNRADQRLLMDLARQAGVRGLQCISIAFSHPPHNLGSKPQAPPGVLTVLRALTLPDGPHSAAVFNALLDHGHAERLALVEGEVEGLALVRGPLMRERTITAAWAKNGWHGYRRGDSETAVPSHQTLQHRLDRDTKSVIAKVQGELGTAEEHLRLAKEELKAAQAEEAVAREAVTAARREKTRADRAKWEAEATLSGLQQWEAPGDESGELAEVQKDIDEAKEDIERRLRPVDEAAKAAVGPAEEAVQAVKARLDAHGDEHKRLEGEMDAATEEYGTANKPARDLQKRLNEDNARCNEIRTQLTRLEERREHLNATLRQATEMAELFCTEEEARETVEVLVAAWRAGRGRQAETAARDPAPLLTSEALDKRLEDMGAKIQRAERAAGGNLEHTKLEAAGLNEQLARGQRDLESLARAHESLEQSHAARKRGNAALMTSTLGSINWSFNYNMRQRGGSGSVNIEYGSNVLELEVKMAGRSAAAVTDLKAISGGERSFVTAAFITALAADIAAPFYCLDEIDVYLDLVNRGKTLEMLIGYAAEHHESQYIMLTPLDVNAIGEARKRVQASHPRLDLSEAFAVIKRMPPPRR
ncbi:hypothetical protein WJX81_005604 [Elliptochloris bilobata]|uniref:RecF/RecN/SMC N-terminal domain-containing protein n=1 Tax=Elliptochloris bilobata TaxID=381761 RepID=A0AAW1QWN9_9CHLO